MRALGWTAFGTAIALGALFFACAASSIAQDTQPQLPQASGLQGGGQSGGRMRGGLGDFPGGARGLMGTVTEAAADHYTIKTDAGEIYTVFFSANTRIMKRPEGRRAPGEGSGQVRGQSRASGEGGSEGERPMPQMLKPTDIKVGDSIMTGGDVDAGKRTVGAMMIMQLDPERAKQMRALEAQYGKTWLAGRITAIDGTKITIDGTVDHTPHAFQVDENTSFRKRRESITMADIKVGDQLRLEGAVKAGVFMATLVNAMEFQSREKGTTPTAPTAPR